MRFTLFYEGELKTRNDPKHKQRIRRHFHPQMKALWDRAPLSEMSEPLLCEGDPSSVLKTVDPFTFAPLACERLDMILSLHVTLLRPEPPGRLLSQGGDIDNRLKTLFDALSIPQGLPPGDRPGNDETPFFCLLEDDQLITDIRVTTNQLLVATESASHAVVLIDVETHTTRSSHLNLGLGT